ADGKTRSKGTQPVEEEPQLNVPGGPARQHEMDALAGRLGSAGKPAEHREGVSLGVRSEPSDEEDGNLVVADVEFGTPGGALGRGGWAEAFGVDAQGDGFQTGPKDR